VQLLKVLVTKLLLLTPEVVDQLGHEGTGSDGGIEDFYLLIDQLFAKMLVAQPISALDHKSYKFTGRIDHAKTVGLFLIVNLVEILVDDLEKFLFLVVV
jgi:hypothetical protein